MDRQGARRRLTRAGTFAATVFLLALMAAFPVRAETVERAAALLDSGEVVAAVQILEPLAEAGDASAEYLLGRTHLDGIGVPQDFTKAAQWIAKAAEKDDARAQNLLGRLHAQGLGVERDTAAAVRWMRRAAEKGDPVHQYDLGILLDDAGMDAQDRQEAARWFETSAAQGHAPAKTSLGLAYQQGTGVPKDLARAARLFGEAADAGDARARNNLGLMLARGEGAPQDYEKAVELFRKAAAQGQSQAMYNLGVMYENGFGIDRDEAKARELYAQAGRTGGDSAADAVSDSGLLYDPRLQPLDMTKARAEDFATAAGNGDPVAMFLLGYVEAMDETQGGASLAATWFERAARLGLPAAMANLGLLHIRGRGVPQDYVVGYMCLNLAAAAGLSEAATLRDRVGATMTPAQLAEARDLVESRWQAIRK